jgi:hypothetical protein
MRTSNRIFWSLLSALFALAIAGGLLIAAGAVAMALA